MAQIKTNLQYGVTGSLQTANIGANQITNSLMADDAIGLAEMASGTDGNVITYDASGNPAVVAVGTSGHFLKSQGAGSVPVFAAAGGGKIGQVVESGSSPNATTISSSTFTQLTDGSTALVASITPSATSSSVLMQVVINARCENSRGYGVSLRRAGVQFFASATAYDVYDESNDGDDVDRSVWFDIDTGISTTSATEYSVYVKTESGNAVVFQYGNEGSKMILWEILA